MEIPYLSYYKKINTLPVLDIKDISSKVLSHQRQNFYFKIGMNISDFNHKTILELCPGTGYNAYYLLTNSKVKKYHLVDNDNNSIKYLKKNISNFNNVKIFNKDITKFKIKNTYDIVIIENAIQGFLKPHQIFNNLAKLVSKNGTIVLTMTDNIGILSEKLRYIFSILLMEQKKITSLNKRLITLEQVFRKHLLYLSKNSRSSKKWVLDNILYEGWITKKKYFDYFDLFKQLKKNKCIIKTTSPNLYMDYKWYKNSNLNKRNIEFLSQYKLNRINLLDFETVFETQNINIKKFNIYLNRIIHEVSHFSFEKKIDKSKLLSIKKNLKQIIKILNLSKVNHSKVFFAICEFNTIIDNFLLKKKINYSTKYFYKFWGRGSIQTSIIKI
jgi:SAM-dependent methyltransferase